MGLAKERMMYEEERGFALLPGFVCDACFNEDVIEAFVREHAEVGSSDYCGRHAGHPIAAPADDVAELIMESVQTEYCDPVHELPYDSREGGYQGTTIDAWELFEEIGAPIAGTEFQQTLIQALHSHEWTDVDAAALRLDEAYTLDWREFAGWVKYGTRFFFLLEPERERGDPGRARSALELLEGIARLAEAAGIIVPLLSGAKFWRVRTHDAGTAYLEAAELGTAPAENATESNRLSPAGIPAFYGAETLETAVAEARWSKPSDKPAWSAGLFETTDDCTILDLANLPEPPSLFDRERRHLRRPLLFLAEFAEQISQPLAADDREHIEYVPTQVVSEYLRVACEPETANRVSGIRYRSAQDEDGICIALFVPNERCGEETLSEGELGLRLVDVAHGSF